MFRTLSRIGIQYPASQLSAGGSGDVRGGDRLPWVPIEGGTDNFAMLEGRTWQVQVHGEPAAELVELCAARGIRIVTLPWTDAAERAGLVRDATHLVRPDGHLAFVGAKSEAPALAQHLDAIRPEMGGAAHTESAGMTESKLRTLAA